MKEHIKIYYTPRTRGRQIGPMGLTDEQINEWWKRVKDAPYNPRRDFDYQGSIGHNVHYRGGQFNSTFKNNQRKS